MNDVLANWRRKPSASPEPEPTAKETEQYLAFDAKDRVSRLKILRSRHPGRSPNYSLLLDIVYSGNGVTQIVLVFTFMMVFIKGRNMLSLLRALEMQTADYVQEYDAKHWRKPTDADAAIIESIEVKLKEAGPGLVDAEKWCAPDSGQSVH
jgi:hypothetical protein